MPKKTKRERRPAGSPVDAATRHPLVLWQWRVVVAAMLIVPLVFVRGASDSFRLPKLLLVQSIGIVLVALYLIRLLYRALPDLPLRSPRIALPLLIVAWTVIAVLVSADPGHSLSSLITVISVMSMYFVAYENASDVRLRGVLLVAIPAGVNAIAAILQSRGIWWVILPSGVSPTADLLRVAPTAFLGNRNYAGSFLVIPLIVCVASMFVTRGRTRAWIGAAIVLILAGLVATNTLTAIAATAAGIVALLFVRAPKAGVIGSAIVAVVIAIVFAATPPLRARVTAIRANLAAKKYDAVVTNRLSAYLAAGEMVRDHPVAGVGPGEFSSRYFDYKIRAARKHARLLGGAGSTESFGEAHNDLLQLAAEAGLPAGFLALASFVVFASSSFAIRRDDDPRRLFVRYASLPAALALLVLGLAQFPLRLPSTMTTIAFVAGLCSGWRDHASD